MEVKKVRLWDLGPGQEGNTGQMLINDTEITKMAYVGVDTIVIDTKASVDELKRAIKDLKQKLNGDFLGYEHSSEVLKEAFSDAGIKANISLSVGYEDIDERIVYDGDFTRLKDWDAELVYSWFDHSNLRIETLGPDGIDIALEVFPDPVSLDEWNGDNYHTGGVGLHQNVYKVHTVDDRELADTYLVEYWSQWQGEHATGKVMTYNQLTSHIKDLGRDAAEYENKIAALGN